jgi:hypothetical protein
MDAMNTMNMRRKARGSAMALYAMFIGTVCVPLLAATVDISRMWVKQAELANAVEAACSAYVNTPDTAVFIESGRTVLGAEARSEGRRLFGYNMPSGGALTGMSFAVEETPGLALVTATCSGRAGIRPVILAGLAEITVAKTVTVKAKYGSPANWGTD